MFSAEGYEALRGQAARVGRSDRGVLRLTGADRTTWLQGLVTNDVLALGAGRRLYSAWLTPQGRMITDLWIVAAPDALLLDVPAPLSASLAARLDGLVFAEDVQIDDVSSQVACSMVVGPLVRGGGVTAAAGSSALPCAEVLVADDTYGVPGLVAYGDLDRLLDLGGLAALKEAPRVDLDTFDVLRIEAGVPRFLVDMTGDTIPLEAGIEDRAISFTKGCYVGQEVIVRVTTRGGGRVAKRLVGLALDPAGTPVPPAGAPVHAGDRLVGHVTSAARSPRLGQVIALGYVHREFVDSGTHLEVLHGEQRIPALVTALPFVASSR